MIELQKPYISVALPGGSSYGGGQQFSENAMIRRCGCGIVAATDLLLYLSRKAPDHAPACFAGMLDGAVPPDVYRACLLYMNRRYFPMIPKAGINGVMLMAGVEKFLRENDLPYAARWCFSPSRLWERMEELLRQDIPVVLSVGPNFPVLWGNDRVRFHIRRADGRYIPAAQTKAHFFTVTGLEDSWMRISSWGGLYYLNRWEFTDYVRRQHVALASNLLFITQK